jgi:hypothetical protein
LDVLEKEPMGHDTQNVVPCMRKVPGAHSDTLTHEALPSWLAEPCGQSRHAVAPAPLANLPTGHREHADRPVAALYEPGGHCGHALAPDTEPKVPSGHGGHSTRPVVAPKRPTAHSQQERELTDEENVPLEQGRHCTEVASEEPLTKLPGGQSLLLVEQELEPGGLEEPAGHWAHSKAPKLEAKVLAGQLMQLVMLSCEANVPGEHWRHEDRPTFGPKVPRPHPVHCEAPPALKKPSGQGTHCSKLPSEAKVPGGQGEHTPLGVRNEPGWQVTLGVTHDDPLLELTVPSGHCVHEAEPMPVVM